MERTKPVDVRASIWRRDSGPWHRTEGSLKIGTVEAPDGKGAALLTFESTDSSNLIEIVIPSNAARLVAAQIEAIADAISRRDRDPYAN